MTIAEQIADCVQRNDHTEASILAAESIGDQFSIDKLKPIKWRAEARGYTDMLDVIERSRIMEYVKKYVRPEILAAL